MSNAAIQCIPVSGMSAETIVMSVISLVALLIALGSLLVAYFTFIKETSPNVIVYLESNIDTGEVALVAKNFGNGIAYDLSFFNYDGLPVLEGLEEKVFSGFLKNGIPMLIPQGSRRTIIHVANEMKDEIENVGYNITVEYFARGRWKQKLVRQPYILDYYSFANSIYIHSNERKILDSLQSLEKSLKKISEAT